MTAFGSRNGSRIERVIVNTSILVVDGFYSDAQDVRQHALASDFSVQGNYPGLRTRPFLHQAIRDAIQSLVQRPIVFWPEDDYNGAFQYTVASDKTWVHSDHTTNRAGVLYLTPDAPVSAGTAFFKHRPTGLDSQPQDPHLQAAIAESSRDEDWERTDYVANAFNRLVLFDSTRFHCSAGYFGTGLEDGRLFQTFFFSVA